MTHSSRAVVVAAFTPLLMLLVTYGGLSSYGPKIYASYIFALAGYPGLILIILSAFVYFTLQLNTGLKVITVCALPLKIIYGLLFLAGWMSFLLSIFLLSIEAPK